jgi:hypothetical protein
MIALDRAVESVGGTSPAGVGRRLGTTPASWTGIEAVLVSDIVTYRLTNTL